MFDFFQFVYELRHKPIGFIVLAASIFVFDRLCRNLVTSQVKRLFHIDDQSEFVKYVKNQQRIEQKLELLLQKEGIEWETAPISDARQQISATRSALYSSMHSIILSLAQHAKKYIQLRRDHMSNINKGILLPLLSAIALFVKEAFGYEVPTETIDTAANIVLYLIFFLGLFMNFKKKKPVPQQAEEMDGFYH